MAFLCSICHLQFDLLGACLCSYPNLLAIFQFQSFRISRMQPAIVSSGNEWAGF